MLPSLYPKSIPFTNGDIAESLGDYLRLRSGLPIEGEVHPAAEYMAERSVRLIDVAAALGNARHLEGAALYRTLTGADFVGALETAKSQAIGIEYRKQANEALQVARSIPSKSMAGIQIPAIDAGELQESSPSGFLAVNTMLEIDTGGAVVPTVRSVRYLVSRELLLNDDAGALTLIDMQLSGMAARVIPQRIAAILEANDNLADGDPLFGTANSTTATGLDISSLNEAAGKLRTMVTINGSNRANIKAKYLIVPAALEMSANLLAESIRNGAEPRITVVPNAWLDASDCYLLGSPDEAPCLIRTFPDATNGVPEINRDAAISYGPDGQPTGSYDGQAWTFRSIEDVGAMTRNIVKITAN
jgi:hypothetical protein